MALNIERRQRYSGQGRTYVRTKAKIPINFDIASLDLMCSFIISENRNVRKGQYINLRNLIEIIDIDNYKNDQEKYKRIIFIKKGLEARLLKGLNNPITIVKYINGGLLDGDIIDIHNFVSLSNDEIDWINETVSKALSYSFIYLEADRAIELFTKFKAADYTSISAIVEEIELFISSLNTKFRKAKVEKNSERVFSLRDENFRSIVSDVYNEINNKYRKLITGMQGVNHLIGGGFENTRVYLFLGLTGVGKSIALLNIAYQIKKYNKGFQPKDPTKRPCIVLLTMENTITETVERLFQMTVGSKVNMKDYTIDEVIHLMKTSGELFLTDESPIDIIIKYKPNRSEDTGYLYTLVEDLEDEGYEVICLIQDHVKRLRAASQQTDIRLELGDVINEMKTFAILKDIPVITVSHINREGAKVIDNSVTSSKTDLTRMLGKGFVGESMLMLDNVDFSAILNVEYDEAGHKYLVLKGIKYRIKSSIDYICQPFVPDNDIKLIEDYYSPVPLYKETLSTVPQLNGAQQQNNSNNKIAMNRFSKGIPVINQTEKTDDPFESLNQFKIIEEKKEYDIVKKNNLIERPIQFSPIVFFNNNIA